MGINIIVFLGYFELFSDERALSGFFRSWGIVPAFISSGEGYGTLVTSMFLHGGIMHLVGNMLFLWIFGDNLEDALGHGNFLGFYLLSGLGAGLMQVMAAPYSEIPVVGASGAIAGVMGGYLLLYPKAKIDILFFFIIIIRIIPVPAWVMLGLWFGLQLLNGAADDGSGGGVAYWAHAGGFIVGFVLCLPVWQRRGGVESWRIADGHPPYPDAEYRMIRTSVPRVPRRRRQKGPWG